MHMGTIGAAGVAQAVAGHALRAGHRVTLSNSRGPETLTEVVGALGAGAFAGTRHDAAGREVVLLAAPWFNVREALTGLPRWHGRILLDATNHFASYAPDFRSDELGETTSSEIVATLTPDARVVKVFNTLPAAAIAQAPSVGGGRRVLFMSGDDANAKVEIDGLLASFGFATIDLGTLAVGGRMQQLGGPLAGCDLVRRP